VLLVTPGDAAAGWRANAALHLKVIVPAAPPEGQTGRRRPLTARQAYPSRRRRRRACDERDHAPVADEMRDLV